ncbi:MAG: serine acetyltransferase, partial [Bacteroidota bacterium]|nr:serine acetyltransferase [Bacteroidota bacterium]
MIARKMTHLLTETVEKLSEPESLKGLFRQHRDGYPLPSSDALKEIILLTRSILFPGYFGKPCVNVSTIKYKIGVDVENLHEMLSQQIFAGLCFDRDEASRTSYNDQKRKASTLALKFIERLPELRHTLGTDVTAAYFGDPAAKSYAEILSCYPTIKALTNYRMAHELFLLGVPLIPRFITEMAHSETGIDIHPGASIGHHFTIDHGTGIVIG